MNQIDYILERGEELERLTIDGDEYSIVAESSASAMKLSLVPISLSMKPKAVVITRPFLARGNHFPAMVALTDGVSGTPQYLAEVGGLMIRAAKIAAEMDEEHRLIDLSDAILSELDADQLADDLDGWPDDEPDWLDNPDNIDKGN